MPAKWTADPRTGMPVLIDTETGRPMDPVDYRVNPETGQMQRTRIDHNAGRRVFTDQFGMFPPSGVLARRPESNLLLESLFGPDVLGLPAVKPPMRMGNQPAGTAPSAGAAPGSLRSPPGQQSSFRERVEALGLTVGDDLPPTPDVPTYRTDVARQQQARHAEQLGVGRMVPRDFARGLSAQELGDRYIAQGESYRRPYGQVDPLSPLRGYDTSNLQQNPGAAMAAAVGLTAPQGPSATERAQELMKPGGRYAPGSDYQRRNEIELEQLDDGSFRMTGLSPYSEDQRRAALERQALSRSNQRNRRNAERLGQEFTPAGTLGDARAARSTLKAQQIQQGKEARGLPTSAPSGPLLSESGEVNMDEYERRVARLATGLAGNPRHVTSQHRAFAQRVIAQQASDIQKTQAAMRLAELERDAMDPGRQWQSIMDAPSGAAIAAGLPENMQAEIDASKARITTYSEPILQSIYTKVDVPGYDAWHPKRREDQFVAEVTGKYPEWADKDGELRAWFRRQEGVSDPKPSAPTAAGARSAASRTYPAIPPEAWTMP